ncbi:MAG: methyltransferase [Gimesia sp.]|uniref:Methyltransferase n=1 Tax=Gimesia maris TaxID=122 RepID=A0A3D3R2A0_9PLAN|nr:methyltransferase [Gimesia sp.]HCO22953.1 methyltransferase [Gimesia maris]|tara:strand:- start:13199 stop:13897 length:699 start_codon:yes stop_codon:yes gene_type:complete
MNQEIWTRVDDYFTGLFAQEDDILKTVLRNSAVEGLPPYQVSPCQGKFLQLLIEIQNSKRVLEIGTLGGYSTIWMSRALGVNGLIVTIEAVEKHAAVAAQNFELARQSNKISLIHDDAKNALQRMINDGNEPFDLIFIDADKPSNPVYLDLALQLSRPGTIIVGDNVVREGEVTNQNSSDDKVRGVRKYCQGLSENLLLNSTAIQTVGSKGYDGFTLTVVKGDESTSHPVQG